MLYSVSSQKDFLDLKALLKGSEVQSIGTLPEGHFFRKIIMGLTRHQDQRRR